MTAARLPRSAGSQASLCQQPASTTARAMPAPVQRLSRTSPRAMQRTLGATGTDASCLPHHKGTVHADLLAHGRIRRLEMG